MRAPILIRHSTGMFQHIVSHTVSQMDEVKSVLDSVTFAAMKESFVRPRFEEKTTWADIVRVLEETGGEAFGRAGSKLKCRNE